MVRIKTRKCSASLDVTKSYNAQHDSRLNETLCLTNSLSFKKIPKPKPKIEIISPENIKISSKINIRKQLYNAMKSNPISKCATPESRSKIITPNTSIAHNFNSFTLQTSFYENQYKTSMNESNSPSNPLFRNTKLKLNRPSRIKINENKLSSEREDEEVNSASHKRQISNGSNDIICIEGNKRGIVKNLKISNEASITSIKDLTKAQKKVNERINNLAERSRSNSKELSASFVRIKNDFSPSIEEDGQAQIVKRNLPPKIPKLDISIKETCKNEKSPLNEDSIDENNQHKRKSHSVQKLPSKNFDKAEVLPFKDKSIIRMDSKTLIRKESQDSHNSKEKVSKLERFDESEMLERKMKREEKAKRAWKKSKIASYAWTWKGAHGFLDP